MTSKQSPTKQQLLKAIEQLEKNPDDRIEILASVGITAIGAVGIGAAAAVLGTTASSIPIITALTGISFIAAAPVALVAGAAIVGGAAAYGVTRLIKDGGFHEGKRKQILNEYQERLKEIEVKEKGSNLDEYDKTQFYFFLKEPLKHNLITAEEVYKLMQAVENGHISLGDAYRLIGQILSENQIVPTPLLTSAEKQITTCPNCSQKLRAPANLGDLTLTCPKCQQSWQWNPDVNLGKHIDP